MSSKESATGMLRAFGGWKLGATVCLSYWSLALIGWTLHPINPNWIFAESPQLKIYCSPWSCLKLIGESGSFNKTSGWATDSTARALGACGKLESHITAVQVFGIITWLCVLWTWLNHTANLMCDCLKRFRTKMFGFHFANAAIAFVTWCTMISAYYGNVCSSSLADTKVGNAALQLSTGAPQLFWLVVIELAQGVLCRRGAYEEKPQAEGANNAGGVLASVGARKLGPVILLSFATASLAWWATNPLLPHEGWVNVNSSSMKVYCSAWWCLQLSGEDGVFSESSGWRKETTLSFFNNSCSSSGLNNWGGLEQSIEQMQIWGAVAFLGVAWSSANHAMNLVCDWLKVFRAKLFMFHAANACFAFLTAFLMAQTYTREFCGEALQDKKYGGDKLRLGFVSFGLQIMTCALEALLSRLCFSGAYGPNLVNSCSMGEEEKPQMVSGENSGLPTLIGAQDEKAKARSDQAICFNLALC